jgi:hypothetical protein
MRALLLCIWFLAAIDMSGAQAVVRQNAVGDAQSNLSGRWSATTKNGRKLAGKWTAVRDPKSGAVTGTWSLVNAKGKTIAGGGWSAAKSVTKWTGKWRAAISGRESEYSGTWTAAVDLKADAPLANLFEKAMQTAVNGKWRFGKQSGGWSIRRSSETQGQRSR